MKKTIITLLILASLGFGAYRYYPVVFSKKEVKQTAMTMPVDVVEVKQKDFYPSLSFVSKIEAKDKVQVRARVTGFLTKRLFTEGDYVKEGQLLFEIEKDQFVASVNSAEADLAKAQANEENAVAQFKRAKDLFKSKDLSQATLDQRQAEYSTAKAVVKQASANLDIAKLNLNYTDVVAPISGRIGTAAYSVGALIGPDSGSLATIVSTNPMYAVFSVSENQLLQMKDFWQLEGEEHIQISFVFDDGKIYNQAGRMNFVDIALDEHMNTMKMRVSFENPENQLIAGQYGRVEMRFTDPQKAILLPSDLIMRDLVGAYVYVVNANNIIEQRRIEKGLDLADGETIVLSGLSIGDKVLASHLQMAPRLAKSPVKPVVVETENNTQKTEEKE
ncbi:MAG: efflux RND transporter periplasmic adaptor subunit [Alphaproteobacteria bacterium]|nr:efflux RND transporter periplasmic adaptor subunit [Alphaproteobacteria bacterium]